MYFILCIAMFFISQTDALLAKYTKMFVHKIHWNVHQFANFQNTQMFTNNFQTCEFEVTQVTLKIPNVSFLSIVT